MPIFDKNLSISAGQGNFDYFLKNSDIKMIIDQFLYLSNAKNACRIQAKNDRWNIKMAKYWNADFLARYAKMFLNLYWHAWTSQPAWIDMIVIKIMPNHMSIHELRCNVWYISALCSNIALFAAKLNSVDHRCTYCYYSWTYVTRITHWLSTWLSSDC